ncbi:MAG: hypothetical protein ABSA46_21975 [Thermodesulfovibrionales bacterium]|jgi:hypothetical protein
MKKKGKKTLSFITLVGIAFVFALGVFALGGTPFAADEGASSTACIKCHTDLNKMDSYGAASAGAGAAIAG